MAQIRFIHTSPDTPAVDLYVNGEGAAYNVSFGTVTSYMPWSPGEVRLEVNRAGTTQALVNTHAVLGGTKQYTAVMGSFLGGLEETVYPDASAPAPAGMVAVRFLHQAAGVGSLDVYLLPPGGAPGSAIASARNLSFGNTEGYVNVPADKTYGVAAVPAGVSPASVAGSVLSQVSVGGGSGAVRTVVLSDATGGRNHGLSGFVLKDDGAF